MRNFLLAAALILAGLGSFDQARAQARNASRSRTSSNSGTTSAPINSST